MIEIEIIPILLPLLLNFGKFSSIEYYFSNMQTKSVLKSAIKGLGDSSMVRAHGWDSTMVRKHGSWLGFYFQHHVAPEHHLVQVGRGWVSLALQGPHSIALSGPYSESIEPVVQKSPLPPNTQTSSQHPDFLPTPLESLSLFILKRWHEKKVILANRVRRRGASYKRHPFRNTSSKAGRQAG